MQPGLRGKAPAGEVKAVVEERRHHRRRGLARMEVDRHVERLGRLEDGPVFGVEILAHRMGVDDHPAEAELPGGALNLPRRRRRILGRDGGKARESSRMSFDRSRKGVIRFRGQSYRQRPVEHLHARRREREDMHVDADRIHVSDTAGADVEQGDHPTACSRASAPGWFRPSWRSRARHRDLPARRAIAP
jgi:hypothetical protein